MKCAFNMVAMLVILMAGFMSMCIADEKCATERENTSAHGCLDLLLPEASTQEAHVDYCGMHCHIAVYSLPQVSGESLTLISLSQDRTPSIDDTISLGLYTVLDQPPRA